MEFPDLFRPSPFRDVQRQASEIDAARSTTEALDEIASHNGERRAVKDLEDGEPEAVEQEGQVVADDEPEPPIGTLYDMIGRCQLLTQCFAELSAEKRLLKKLPSLYPSYLPYQAQHMILNKAQQVLEEYCFDFATTSMPLILQEKRWDCPAAVELTQWTKIFQTRKDKLRLHTVPTDFGTKEMKELLTTVSNLRHTAVHRLPTTARGVSQLLESAMKLAQILQDDLRAAQLEELWCDVNSQIKAMELNKNVLEDTVSGKLQDIQRKRGELDRMEVELIQGMLKDDMDNNALIGQLLGDSIRRIFGKREEEADKKEELNETMNAQTNAVNETAEDSDTCNISEALIGARKEH